MHIKGFVPRHVIMASTKRLTLRVARKTPELLCPAVSTPNEFKSLSDIDDQRFLRRYVGAINFYKKNPSMEGKDPVKIIREAIAKALVFYYPLAGRLREHTGRKLVVECTGQGVVFAEADADATLQHFGENALYPPFPNLDGISLHMPNDLGIFLDIPLMFIQVTRLKCGGFIFSNYFNHTVCDGVGLSQFLSAVGELAGGAAFPSIQPVWDRHLLSASQPPRVSFAHHEYDVSTSGGTLVSLDTMEERSFFSSAKISALRCSLPPHLQRCSKFDIVAGCVWRCQTIALSPEPDEEIRFSVFIDNRKLMKPQLPMGYYGNAIAFPVVVTTAGELSKNPLHYAVELVRKAKREVVTDEYLRSVAGLMVMRDRPSMTEANTYVVSNMTHVGFEQMDVGWGTAEYGGMSQGIYRPTDNIQIAWYSAFKDGFMVPVSLPLESMKVFEKHLQVMMTTAPTSSSL
ncbi:benzyl alcohol O-benzoyltransferase-like [Salvia hispanica]|uniref:benzyl alcohol O-benzoyltransferase-like n=1 Tax=Salvia hispanica TaxID=49212 RepID=UPI0020091392|nr:benzyl alcohol O-benzoyltransferase-like [Salvia hispanica]